MAATQTRTEREPVHGGRFALFSECMLAGALTLLLSVPLVTLPAALAAGGAHVRACAEGEGSTRIADYVARFRAARRGSAGVSAIGIGLAAVLAADLVIVRSGVPGGRIVLAACTMAAAAAAVIGLRAAVAWHPDARWPELLAGAADRARTDTGGSLLLATAVVIAATGVWALPPLVLPMTGCVLLAAVVVDRRDRSR